MYNDSYNYSCIYSYNYVCNYNNYYSYKYTYNYTYNYSCIIAVDEDFSFVLFFLVGLGVNCPGTPSCVFLGFIEFYLFLLVLGIRSWGVYLGNFESYMLLNVHRYNEISDI